MAEFDPSGSFGRIGKSGRKVLYTRCRICGKRWAEFGYGVNLRDGKPGHWYCAEHRPEKTHE